jgi:subtilisin family serine protease
VVVQVLDSEQPSDIGAGPEDRALLGTAETTGRYVVVFADADDDTASDVLRSMPGISEVADARDFGGDPGPGALEQLEGADATWIPGLGVAVVSAEPADVGLLQTQESTRGSILVVEPELVHRVQDPGSPEYLAGYQDGVGDLAGRLGGRTGGDSGAGTAATATFADTAQLTWGLQATGAGTSTRSGAGIRVAVLDTGFDLTHPDFTGRAITSKSFISGQAVQDGHGHGTHCVGTSCGPRVPTGGTRRYGCAPEAEIYVGKVLSNGGSGSDAQILLGIDWALRNGCQVVSMSLGADLATVSRAYEVVGARALDRGSLIVAAAGNNAHRPSSPGFVGVPANSPSIAAVAALDSQLAVAAFSARSNVVRGGQVDIAGPGVAVFSSWPVSKGSYRSISGTSMATPHAAGVAALWAQATGRRGRELWWLLTTEARREPTPSFDVGAGLVQAPQ